MQDLLPPVHPHVVVHVDGVEQLFHRRVPVRVVGPGVLRLLAGVEVLALVALVLFEGLSGPLRDAGVFVVVRGVVDEVYRRYAALKRTTYNVIKKEMVRRWKG